MRRSPDRHARIAALVVAAACGSPAKPSAPRACPAGPVMLAGQDDVAALAGCESVAGLAIRTGEALDLAPLERLQRIAGDLTVGPSVGFSELSLRAVREVGGTIKIAGNANLMGVFLPQLARAGAFDIGGNVALTTVSMPRLESTGTLAVVDNPALELVDLTKLGAVERELALVDNGKLVLVDAPALARAGAIRVSGNKILPDEQVQALRKLAP